MEDPRLQAGSRAANSGAEGGGPAGKWCGPAQTSWNGYTEIIHAAGLAGHMRTPGPVGTREHVRRMGEAAAAGLWWCGGTHAQLQLIASCHCLPPHRAATAASCCFWATASPRSGAARFVACHATLCWSCTATSERGAGHGRRLLHGDVCKAAQLSAQWAAWNSASAAMERGLACSAPAAADMQHIGETCSAPPGTVATSTLPSRRFAGLMQRYFGQYNPMVQAVAGDRTANLLWRINQGGLPTQHQVGVLLLSARAACADAAADGKRARRLAHCRCSVKRTWL